MKPIRVATEDILFFATLDLDLTPAWTLSTGCALRHSPDLLLGSNRLGPRVGRLTLVPFDVDARERLSVYAGDGTSTVKHRALVPGLNLSGALLG